jgi:hypothetical protein
MMETGGQLNLAGVKSTQMVTFATEEEQEARVYDYLWISERFYLKGICMFLQHCQTEAPRMLSHSVSVPLNCVFSDIIRLDFMKFKQVMEEH